MGTSFQTHQDGPFPTIPRRNHHHQQRYQWYELIPVGIWFGIISTFKVFLGWMCMLCDPICFSYFFSSSWVWNGLPHLETIKIHHKCYGNIISDPSRWTIPNYTEEKPSPSTKIPMIWVDTSGYLIWNHFHLQGIFGLDVYVMWPDMFFLLFLIFMRLKWFTTSWNHRYSSRMLWKHHFRPIKMDHSQLYRGATITINKDTNEMGLEGTRGLKWSYLSEPSRIIAVLCATSRTPG